ncbi:hypothetical protein [Actimicrobium antarcticum]|uniref:Lipoprotein n=1 Tax=Actimicrobium antarcticum TaxID=1051899 RepID=A0ABP7SQR7_9BURK
MMRRFALALASVSVLVAGCATVPASQTMLVETRSDGQPLAGATCLVSLGSEGYTVVTPATVSVAGARGDLQVVCNKPGYRSSELLFRSARSGFPNVGIGASGGSGGNLGLGLGLSFPLQGGRPDYPPRVSVEMALQ